MRRCDYCGQELKEADRFCTQCGTPVSQTAAPDDPAADETPGEKKSAKAKANVETKAPPAAAGKKPAKTVRVLLAAAALVVLAAVIVIGTGALKSGGPEELVSAALGKTLEYLISPQEGAAGLLAKAARGGSIELRGGLMGYTNGNVPLEGSVKLYPNMSEGTWAAVLALDCEGYDSTDMTLHRTRDDIVLSGSLFHQGPYGVSLKDGAQALDDSTFAPGTYSDYELDEETFSALRNFLSLQNDAPKALKEELGKVSGKYIELLVKAAVEAGSVSTRNVELKVGSQDVKAVDVLLRMDGPALAKALKTLAKEAGSDEALRKAAADLAKQAYASSAGLKLLEYGYNLGFLGWYYSFLRFDDFEMPSQAEIEEIAARAIDQFVQRAREQAAYLESGDFQLQVEFYVAKKAKTLAAITVKAWEHSDKVFSLEATIGENIYTSKSVHLKVFDGWNTTQIRYSVDDNNEEYYLAELVFDNGYDYQRIAIFWDKKTGKWEIGESGWSLEGTLEKSGRDATVTITRYQHEDYYIDKELGMALVIREKDTAPAPGAYTNLLTLSQYQLNDLFAQAQESFQVSPLFVLLWTLTMY